MEIAVNVCMYISMLPSRKMVLLGSDRRESKCEGPIYGDRAKCTFCILKKFMCTFRLFTVLTDHCPVQPVLKQHEWQWAEGGLQLAKQCKIKCILDVVSSKYIIIKSP